MASASRMSFSIPRSAIRRVWWPVGTIGFHETKDQIGVLTDTGSGQLTHPFFLGSKTSEDLVKGRDAIAELQKVAFGWMGRSPDYKASFLGTLGANSGFYGEYAGNAKKWYSRTQERLDFWNHAIVNPPVDRDRAIEEVYVTSSCMSKRKPTPG